MICGNQKRRHGMPAAAARPSGQKKERATRVGEWFWRFLAAVMLLIVGWVVWIAVQISPPDLILPAAFEAAAQGRATRNSAGVIGGAGIAPAQEATAPAVISLPAVVFEHPVNLEKLKLAKSIETPIVERPRRAAKPATEVSQ
jgi:hypothetical protein